MINLHRDQADIIREVFCRCKLLNLADELLAELVRRESRLVDSRRLAADADRNIAHRFLRLQKARR